MRIEIELSTFTFRRADHVIEVNPEGLNADIIAQLVYHGATQKIGDAAAGKSGDDAEKAMLAVRDTLYAGDWGRARTGNGEPEWMAYARELIRLNLGEANRKLYKELDDAKERKAFLNGLFEGLSEEKAEKIEVAAKTNLAKAKAEKAANKAFGADLGL